MLSNKGVKKFIKKHSVNSNTNRSPIVPSANVILIVLVKLKSTFSAVERLDKVWSTHFSFTLVRFISLIIEGYWTCGMVEFNDHTKPGSFNNPLTDFLIYIWGGIRKVKRGKKTPCECRTRQALAPLDEDFSLSLTWTNNGNGESEPVYSGRQSSPYMTTSTNSKVTPI